MLQHAACALCQNAAGGVHWLTALVGIEELRQRCSQNLLHACHATGFCQESCTGVTVQRSRLRVPVQRVSGGGLGWTAEHMLFAAGAGTECEVR